MLWHGVGVGASGSRPRNRRTEHGVSVATISRELNASNFSAALIKWCSPDGISLTNE
jgi:hypothetical protein